MPNMQPPWETTAKTNPPPVLEVDAANIPQELKARRRWLVWKAEPKANGKINKPPFQAENPTLPASTKRSAHYASFDAAIEAVTNHDDLAGIGFVVAAGDGLVMIDMDDCMGEDGEPDVEAMAAINAFHSYTERSPSGNGIRIICKGTIPHDFTNNKIGREMYAGGGARYLTITGQVLEDLTEIDDAQEAIDFYFPQWDSRKNGTAVHKEIKAEIADSVDISRLSEFTLNVIRGDFSPYDGDRSLALLGICKDMIRDGFSDAEILTITTDSSYPVSAPALDRRRSRESAVEWVIAYTLQKAHRDVADEPKATFRVEDLAKQAQPQQEKKVKATFATDSGVDLHSPPGLVGDITREILANAIRPQEMFAVSGALMTVSIASENYYRCAYMGGSVNLYMVQVGSTASGKDGPRKALKAMMRKAGKTHIAPEAVSSGAALLRSLSKNQTICYMPDEFGLLLQTALNDRGSIHLKDMVSELMRLYSLGDSVHTGKRYANEDDNITEIVHPFVGMLATTTPEELAQALTLAQVDNGFLNRILYVEAEHEKPPKNRAAKPGFSDTIVDSLAALSAHAGGIPASIYKPRVIAYKKEAAALLDAFDDECDTRCDGEFGAIWNRAHENAIRVAGVLALGMPEPVVSADLAAWAIAFVRWCVNGMLKHLSDRLSGSQFEADFKRAYAFIENATAYQGDARFGPICALGAMPKGKLTKLMRMPSRQLAQVIDYLIDAEMIEKGEAEGDNAQRKITAYRAVS